MLTRPFPFLDLPAEIREKIYILLCTHSLPYTPLDIPDAKITYPHDLLLINAQIYQEVLPLYFSINTFCFTVRRSPETLTPFISPSFLFHRRLIRSLRIRIRRWGTQNFFLKTMIPVLEDCILNGRLRILEIVVLESLVKKTLEKSNLRNNDHHVGEEYENWRALKRIFGDPYMQKNGLWASSSQMEVGGHDDGNPLHIGAMRDIKWMLDGVGNGGRELRQ